MQSWKESWALKSSIAPRTRYPLPKKGGSSVKQISEYAFSGCNNLKIYCEDESKLVGWGDDWNSRRPVFWGVKEIIANIEQDGIQYSITDTEAILLSYNGNFNELSIPSTVLYNGKTYSVTRIGDYAFSNCKTLTKVKIPNSVMIIGDYAFSSFRGSTIIIPDSVTTIGSFAFSGCGALTIYCEAESQPSGWSLFWNDLYSQMSPNHFYAPVVWDYKETN